MGIVRQFPFSSALQRMAVICKQINKEQLHFFCKGSPEMIQSLSKPETGDANLMVDVDLPHPHIVECSYKKRDLIKIINISSTQQLCRGIGRIHSSRLPCNRSCPSSNGNSINPQTTESAERRVGTQFDFPRYIFLLKMFRLQILIEFVHFKRFGCIGESIKTRYNGHCESTFESRCSHYNGDRYRHILLI